MSTDPRHEEKRRWRLAHPESVRRSNRKQYLKSLDKRKAYDKAYRLANLERIKAYMRQYNKDRYSTQREKILAQTKAYAKTHPEIRKKCAANYAARYPERIAAYRAACGCKRKAVMRGAKCNDPHVNGLIRQWKLKPFFICHWCGLTFTRDSLHIDHIIPVTLGGKHTVSNLCESCYLCNIRKRNKMASLPDYCWEFAS